MAAITILTVGSRGDVQPFCAIARALLNKGHQVTLASSPNFADFAADLGIPFTPVAGSFKQILSSEAGIELLEGNTNVNIIDEETLWQQMTDGWSACQGSNLIVFSPLATWGYNIAEALKIPAVLATQVPVSATKAFPFLNFANRTNNPLTGQANLLSYRLVSFLFWRCNAKTINRFRQTVLDLPPLPFLGAKYRRNPPPQLTPLPIINCFSAAVIPPPSDWPDFTHQAGYCFLNTTENATTPYSLPPGLQTFLEQTPKPLYVGFGSMIARDPQQLAETVISAFEETKQRAVLCSGWGEIKQKDLPDSIYLAESIPHDWLFPKVTAAIHHGGAGTTAATLNAGIPSIVVPFFADQPIWGAQLEELGVSPATLPRAELKCDLLVESIRQILEDDSFHTNAKDLQTRIHAERGLEKTVSVIEFYLR